MRYFKCKCGHDDFAFVDKDNQRGIYCTHCGRPFKMAKSKFLSLVLQHRYFKPEEWYSRQIIKNVKMSEKDKETLIEKWDNVRYKEYEGEESCKEVGCLYCPLRSHCQYYSFILRNFIIVCVIFLVIFGLMGYAICLSDPIDFGKI